MYCVGLFQTLMTSYLDEVIITWTRFFKVILKLFQLINTGNYLVDNLLKKILTASNLSSRY